jgi:hypothetical protein
MAEDNNQPGAGANAEAGAGAEVCPVDQVQNAADECNRADGPTREDGESDESLPRSFFYFTFPWNRYEGQQREQMIKDMRMSLQIYLRLGTIPRCSWVSQEMAMSAIRIPDHWLQSVLEHDRGLPADDRKFITMDVVGEDGQVTPHIKTARAP